MLITGVTLAGTYVVDHPPVVASGLQQYFDIGNSSSYPGTGTTLTDLSGSAFGNGALTAGVTYNSVAAGSYLTFNGSTTFAQTANLYSMVAGTLNVTIEVWVRTSSDNGVVISEQGTVPFDSGWHDAQIVIVSGILKSTVWSYNTITGPAVTRGTWQQYVLNYNNATTTQTLYVNGVSVASNTNARSFGGTVLYYTIARGDFTSIGDTSYLACDWSIFRVYNRSLTAAEVLQNYNADKGRYL